MGRKKTICSFNAAIQVDGQVHYTFREGGKEIGITQMSPGHVGKIYRSLIGMQDLLSACHNTGYIDKDFQKQKKNAGIRTVLDILKNYPNNPVINRLRIDITNALQK